MNSTLTITSLDVATRTWIQDEARRTGTSVEIVIERLILRGLAAERQSSQAQTFHDLDSLAGTWSAEEADALREATATDAWTRLQAFRRDVEALGTAAPNFAAQLEENRRTRQAALESADDVHP